MNAMMCKILLLFIIFIYVSGTNGHPLFRRQISTAAPQDDFYNENDQYEIDDDSSIDEDEDGCPEVNPRALAAANYFPEPLSRDHATKLLKRALE